MREEAVDGTGIDLHLLRRRDPDAVERWFLQYADALYTFVLHRVGKDEDLAADVAQDTFVHALKNIGDYRPERGSMFAWLTWTARNRIRRSLRVRRRFAPLIDAWDAADRELEKAAEAVDPRPLSRELLERRETEDLVQMALANVPFRYGKVLRRHYCHEQPLRQIAASEGMTEGAVKALLHRARLAFKAAFQALGGTCFPAAEKDTIR